jgi:hypothetical protein
MHSNSPLFPCAVIAGQELPNYTISLNGTTFTQNGQNVTAQCGIYYSTTMGLRAEDIAEYISLKIGTEFCLDLGVGDLFTDSVSTTLLYSENKVKHLLDHLHVLSPMWVPMNSISIW